MFRIRTFLFFFRICSAYIFAMEINARFQNRSWARVGRHRKCECAARTLLVGRLSKRCIPLMNSKLHYDCNEIRGGKGKGGGCADNRPAAAPGTRITCRRQPASLKRLTSQLCARSTLPPLLLTHMPRTHLPPEGGRLRSPFSSCVCSAINTSSRRHYLIS